MLRSFTRTFNPATPSSHSWDDELMQLALDLVPGLVFVKDAESRIIYANRAFLDLYPAEKRHRIVGNTGVEDFPAEEAELFLAQDRRALEIGDSQVVEEITAPTGEKRIFNTRKIRFETPQGKLRLLGMGHDITELVERERTLAALNNRLQHFSAIAAHDLRSPLATFINALESVQNDQQSQLSAKSRERIEQMVASASSLMDNIHGLLSAIKAEHGSQPIQFTVVDMNLLLADVKFNLKKAIADAQALVLSPRLPMIVGHETLLRQLLQNLVENSIKYANPGRMLQITIGYHRRDEAHEFWVEDNGSGVSAEAATKVFALFAQDDPTKAGAGIGLSLCKSIAALHRGTIALDTPHQQGCRIVFTIATALTPSVDVSH